MMKTSNYIYKCLLCRRLVIKWRLTDKKFIGNCKIERYIRTTHVISLCRQWALAGNCVLDWRHVARVSTCRDYTLYEMFGYTSNHYYATCFAIWQYEESVGKYLIRIYCIKCGDSVIYGFQCCIGGRGGTKGINNMFHINITQYND